MRRLVLVLALAVLPAFPATASAADVVIGFDDLPPDTRVIDQYQGQGLRLSRDASGHVQNEDLRVRSRASGGNMLELAYGCAPPGSSGEFPCDEASDFNLHGRLDFARQRISVVVVAQAVGPTTLIGRSPNGTEVAKATVANGAAEPFKIEAVSQNQNIAFFELQGARYIDDVTYDNPSTPPPPDFSIAGQFTDFQDPAGIGVKAGTSLTIPILVNRFNFSQGSITLTPTVPSGSPVSSGAQTTTGPDGTVLNFTFAVPANAAPQEVPVTVRATAGSIAAGPANATRDVTFSLRIFRDYDLQTTGIEVTQGIQRELIRCMNQDACDENFSLPFRLPGSSSAPVPYHSPIFGPSSTMVQGKRTVARVFANVRDPAFPNGIAVDRVGMRLRAFGTAGELKESPLQSEGGLRPVSSGGPGFTTGGSGKPYVTFKDRADPNGAFNFTLPDSWTRRGAISLRAELVPPDDLQLGGQQSSLECQTAACKANNVFTLSGIPFHKTGSTRVAFAWLYTDADSRFGPISPWQFTPYAQLVIPFAEGDLRTDRGYYASVNVQEALDEYPGNDDDSRRDRMYAAKDILEDYASDYPGCSYLDFCAEVISGIMSMRINNAGVSDGDYPGVNVAAVNRTPTIAHEISHNLGREHSGEDCPGIGENGQTAEDWAPDQRGLIHGIGLDTRPNSGGFNRYRVIAPGNLGAPDSPGVPLLDFPLSSPTPTVSVQDEWFDQQSYCREGDEDRWTSVLGHERFFRPTFANLDGVPPSLDADKFAVKAQRPAPRRLLHVQAVAGTGVTPKVTVVKERTLRPRTMPASSSFHLVARNAAGAVLADVPMDVDRYEPDPTLQLTGQAPVTGAASVEVTFNGAAIARRARSAAAPRVRITTPLAGRRVGAGRVATVRWTATDADAGDRLRAKVDYSFDDGRNWTVLFVGPNRGSTAIPSAYLSRSSRARVRVRVSDGFNEGQATSARFTAVGRPPSVGILTPTRRGQRIAQDAWLSLSGEATDDRRRRLAGRSVRWFDGRRLIATGPRASVTGLRLGRRGIRMTARDAFGRQRSTFATVTVVAVPPQFLRLTGPARLSRNATVASLRVRTNVTSILTARGRRAVVGRGTRTVRLPVPRGRATLAVPVTLRSGRFTARRVLTIPRS
ncbi:MAG TPA: hypothetical protein VNB64_12625 [Solirubrobacteraceae bacterium]|nr:hypothetical protein [Solirubrobacteraceae bacterium]